MMHIYAFGSICRGDLSVESDIDLLALVQGRDPRLNQDKFSIYSYRRISNLWEEGNAFAWHLALESKLIYSEDGNDFIFGLGMPSVYAGGPRDCARFRELIEASVNAIEGNTPSLVFELSTVFLALRNLATCYSLAKMVTPTFGRDSARRLGTKSLSVSEDIYKLLMDSRLLSTRGIGGGIGAPDIMKLVSELTKCRQWANKLCDEVGTNG